MSELTLQMETHFQSCPQPGLPVEENRMFKVLCGGNQPWRHRLIKHNFTQHLQNSLFSHLVAWCNRASETWRFSSLLLLLL